MRTMYYVLLFICLFFVLVCVNLVRWFISKFQLALGSVGWTSRSRPLDLGIKAAIKNNPFRRPGSPFQDRQTHQTGHL